MEKKTKKPNPEDIHGRKEGELVLNYRKVKGFELKKL